MHKYSIASLRVGIVSSKVFTLITGEICAQPALPPRLKRAHRWMLLSWFPLFQPAWRKHFGWLQTSSCKESVKVKCVCVCVACERWHKDSGSLADPIKALLTFSQRERKGQRKRKMLSVWSYVWLLVNFISWNIPRFCTVAIVTYLFNCGKYLNSSNPHGL